MKVAIIDYNMGNLFSVKRALSFINIESIITNDRNEIFSADAAILPGVGAFGEAVNNLKQNNLDISILDFIDTGKPFMGICLGMQLLFTQSYEFGLHMGLNVIKGSVVRFDNKTIKGKKLKVPHVAWSKINKVHGNDGLWNNSLLRDVREDAYMYFVHSFYVKPEQKENILSTSCYGGRMYCSGVKKENVEAFQFHPEKSGRHGLKILLEFKERINQSIHKR